MPLDQNFALIDLRAAALASVLFSLFAFAPGYALGWSTSVLSFRQRLLSTRTRLLIAIVISVSVSPALSYWVGMLSVWAIWAVTVVSAVAVAILLIRELRGGIPQPVVAFDGGCGSTSGGPRQDCVPLISRILPVFPAPALPQPIDLEHIDVLVIQDTGPVWVDRSSWIWQIQPLVANDFFRAVPAPGISLFGAHQK